ncbi:MAG: hypothetical protein ACK5DD_09035 [Cyclobacteriaceae bacterium]|jgi:hypothetical protein
MRSSTCLWLAFVAASCAPAYLPNTRNVPLFREAQEFSAAVTLSTAIDAQAAYAVTDNIAIMGNYSFLTRQFTDPDFQKKHNFFEGGLGLYGVQRKFRYELFAGYGAGKSNSFDQYSFIAKATGVQEQVEAEGTYSRIFIQPTLATNNRGFNLAFTPRISSVQFSEFVSNGVTYKPEPGRQIILEPALTAIAPIKGNLRGFFQLGLNVGLGDVYFDYEPLQFAFGIQLHTGSLRTRVY